MFDLAVETLGERICRLRKARGWSLQKLAEIAGISKDGLWQIEKDQVKNPYSLAEIARALEVTVAEIRGEAGGELIELVKQLPAADQERLLKQLRRASDPMADPDQRQAASSSAAARKKVDEKKRGK